MNKENIQMLEENQTWNDQQKFELDSARNSVTDFSIEGKLELPQIDINTSNKWFDKYLFYFSSRL